MKIKNDVIIRSVLKTLDKIRYSVIVCGIGDFVISWLESFQYELLDLLMIKMLLF